MRRQRLAGSATAAALALVALSACGGSGGIGGPGVDTDAQIAECLDAAVKAWEPLESGASNMRPTGVIAKHEPIDDGAEVWMRVMYGGPAADWGEDTWFDNDVHSCSWQSSDEITISDEPHAEEPEANVPSEAADSWNADHARDWAEENVSDLVNIDDIPRD